MNLYVLLEFSIFLKLWQKMSNPRKRVTSTTCSHSTSFSMVTEVTPLSNISKKNLSIFCWNNRRRCLPSSKKILASMIRSILKICWRRHFQFTIGTGRSYFYTLLSLTFTLCIFFLTSKKVFEFFKLKILKFFLLLKFFFVNFRF